MEKSFTPKCSPEQFEKLLAESHVMLRAKYVLVQNIMAYVYCTKHAVTKTLGDVKFFLN